MGDLATLVLRVLLCRSNLVGGGTVLAGNLAKCECCALLGGNPTMLPGIHTM